MRRFPNIHGADIERLFEGRAPHGDAEVAEVARFFDELTEAYPEASTEHLEATHVAAMIETAHLLAENGEPVVRPASKAYGPENQASGLLSRRRVIMWKELLTSTKGKVAIATAALVLATAGTALAAEAGVLPDPLQDAVAGVAGSVGIDLPDSQEANVDEGALEDVDDDQSGDADEGDAGNVDDDQSGDADEGDAGNVDDDQSGDADEGDAGNVDDDQSGDSQN